MPAHLSKGLEFDAVMIAFAEKYQRAEMDLKLLYVAMTRAMHILEIHCLGNDAPLLEGFFERRS